jgi:hypothetical protein
MRAALHMPSASMLVRLAVVLRVTVDGLLGYPGLDPSLGRFLRTVDSMDERTRRFALETLDGMVNTYQALSGGRQDEARE